MASYIRRRKFLATLGGAAAAWPLAARAQQRERMRRIGVLMHLAADDPEGQRRVAAFLQGLQEAGWAGLGSKCFKVERTGQAAFLRTVLSAELS